MSNDTDTDKLDDLFPTDQSVDDVAEERIPDDVESSGAVTGPQDESYDPIKLYDLQRHRNGDETAVLLCSFGNGYQAIAMDIDAGGQILETEQIGDSPDDKKAVGMVEYWLQQNPGGILGGAPENEGFLSKLGLGGESQ